jgi:hypothetical protein
MKHYFVPINGIQWLTLALLVTVCAGFAYGFNQATDQRVALAHIQAHQGDSVRTTFCYFESLGQKSKHLTPGQKRQEVKVIRKALAKILCRSTSRRSTPRSSLASAPPGRRSPPGTTTSAGRPASPSRSRPSWLPGASWVSRTPRKTRTCRCHGEPMDRNHTSSGGWTCAVKRRARQLVYYHRRKHDPDYQLNRQLRELARVRVRY